MPTPPRTPVYEGLLLTMAISLHVRHEVTPERCLAVLQALEQGEPYDHITQPERQVARLRQLGLVQEDVPSPLGATLLDLCRQKPDLWGDMAHFLHYTVWDSEGDSRPGLSWTYRRVTDAAWSLSEFALTAETREAVASSLINQVEDEPGIDIGDLKKEAASLSKDSVNGVLHWFAALVPPTREDDTFHRRHFCPRELTLLATAWVCRRSDADLGIDLLLTPARREAICRLCLLEPAALDRTLDWMLPSFARIVVPGTTAGAYGRFLRFLKWPTFADLVRP